LHSGTALTFGAALGVYLDARHAFTFGPELAAASALAGSSFLASGSTVAHLLIGAHYLASDGPLEVGVAAGPDFGKGPGSADYRALLYVGMVPERALMRPIDSDGDGIFDNEDACRSTRGIRSTDPEKNGCPAVADMDSDNIPDEQDACPTAAGVPSPERMLNGCPPLPPSPSSTPATVELTDEAIVISQQIAFETGSAVLLAESDGILTEVARVLADHPEIELLEVQGHTDERGTIEFNRKLSQDRASSVVSWLRQHGVAASRLVARGYGRERPIADNSSEEGMQKNRRVEFHVLRSRALPATSAPAPSP
jgi:OOP family OmpA-OmpF porin